MKKKSTIVIFLTISNLVFATTAFGLYIGYGIQNQVLGDQIFHLNEKNQNLKNFILDENKGLTTRQFMEKYDIHRQLKVYEIDTKVIHYDLLYFQFNDDGVLVGIE